MSKGNTRLLVIVAIIVLFVASWYSLLDYSASKTNQYNKYLQIARDKKAVELYDDANDNYKAALAMKDTMELRDEIAGFYKEIGKSSNYVGFCEEILSLYPNENLGYERLAEYYKDTSNYYTCFNLIKTAEKRGIVSEKLQETVQELAFKYELTYVAFEDVLCYSSGYYAVKKPDGYWGYINPYGTTKIQFIYEDAECFTGSGLAAVKNQKGKYVLIDTTNRTKVVDREKRNIEDCTVVASGKIAVKYGGKYHYCDSEFNELFGNYDFAGAFNCGVAAVMNNDEWFVIDENGNKVTDTVFEDIKVDDKGVAFRNNVGFAKLNGKYFLIDTSGNKVGTGEWVDADAFNSDQPAAVKSDERWGFVNVNGELLVDYKFTEAKSFANGLAAVQRNDRWGYIDIDSFEEKIECSFQDAMDFNDCGSTFVYSNDKWILLKIYRLSREK